MNCLQRIRYILFRCGQPHHFIVIGTCVVLQFKIIHKTSLNFNANRIWWCRHCTEVLLSFVMCTLTHWGRVTHICVSKQTIIGSDNGLSPGRRQAIIWTNAEILLTGPLRTNFSEIFTEIQKFSFKKMHFKMSSGKWRPFCLGLNVLTRIFFCSTSLSCIFSVFVLFTGASCKKGSWFFFAANPSVINWLIIIN